MFVVGMDRLEEVTELYRSLGYEIMLKKPPKEEFGPECGECADKICEECWIIYIRKKKRNEKDLLDELYDPK